MFKYNDMNVLKKRFAGFYGEDTETIGPPIQITPGIPQVMILKGTEREMGFQYGAKFAYKFHSLLTIMKAAVISTHGEETMIKDLKAMEFLADKYDPGFREWVEGVRDGINSKGFDFSYLDMILCEVYAGERWARAEGAYPEGLDFGENHSTGGNVPHPYCNAFAAAGDATKDGEPIIATSGSNSDETPERVILVCYPTDKPYFITFGTLGSPHTQIGMTSAGFSWTSTANFSPIDCDWGLFPEIVSHHLSTACSTPKEAQEWLKSVPRIGAVGNVITTDLEGNITVTETNSDHYNIRKPGDGGEEGNYVVSTNHFAAEHTLQFNVPEYEPWTNDSKCRFATVSKLIAQAIEDGGVDFEAARKMIRCDDWFDPNTGEWHYNEPESMKGYNLLEYTHSAVVHPSDMTAYFELGTGSGTGVPAGSMGEFVKMKIMEDPLEMFEEMRNDTFFVNYYGARSAYRKVLNKNEKLQQDYASQEALEALLDKAYIAYEKALNRSSYAIMLKHDGGCEQDFLNLLSEAFSHLAESQLYSKKLIAQLEYYGGDRGGAYLYLGCY